MTSFKKSEDRKKRLLCGFGEKAGGSGQTFWERVLG